ncbi:MAG TPA: hypothetical protein VK110_06645, partial [Salinisphaeraceae bacterium]|nr:hypothetical protein [Salinisphaeraceae bacterium]
MPKTNIDCDSPTVGSHGFAGWYFGWNIVALATLMVLLTVGLRLGIGPFFFPISADLGFSRSLLSGLVAIAMLSYGLVMPFAGWVV